MNKYLVIKSEDGVDLFHSIVKEVDFEAAGKTLQDSLHEVEDDFNRTYKIFPLVEYEFDEKQKVVVPPGTPMQILTKIPM